MAVLRTMIPAICDVASSLGVSCAGVYWHYDETLLPVLCISRPAHRAFTRKAVQGVVTVPEVVNIGLAAARRKRGVASENFELQGVRMGRSTVKLDDADVLNVGSVAVHGFVLLLLNLSRGSFDKRRPAGEAPWTNVLLKRIRDRLVISPLQVGSMTFIAQFDDLLRDEKYRDRWVAYHLDQRFGPFVSEHEALRYCMDQGVPRLEIYLGFVEEFPEEDYVSRPISTR